jgi:hypothetical protein
MNPEWRARRRRPSSDGCRVRPAYAAVVEQDDLALARKPVDEHAITRVEIAPEVLQEEQRRRAALGVAEAPVRALIDHRGAHLTVAVMLR